MKANIKPGTRFELKRADGVCANREIEWDGVGFIDLKNYGKLPKYGSEYYTEFGRSSLQAVFNDWYWPYVKSEEDGGKVRRCNVACMIEQLIGEGTIRV